MGTLRGGLRFLLVTADDFGIGTATSRGILDLAESGIVTGTVLLVNTPDAEADVAEWRNRGGVGILEMGWHPNLTLDRPVTPADHVPSLVRPDGTFYPLNDFLKRQLLGRFNADEIALELRAQYRRFVELVGCPPGFVNGHQHIHLFSPVAVALIDLLRTQSPLPLVRRVRESLRAFWTVPGARVKRLFLCSIGCSAGRLYEKAGFPGNDGLAGVTDPKYIRDPDYLTRWLSCIPGRMVELACHPGYRDETLLGRDCTLRDGGVERRTDELRLLTDPRFKEVCNRSGFELVAPSQLPLAEMGDGVRSAPVPRASHSRGLVISAKGA